MKIRPRTYRKKPVEVSAVEFRGGPDNAALIVRWIMDNGGRAGYETVDMDTVQGMVSISTLEGRMYATPGDFIIQGVRGEFYPCKPEIFHMTYEEELDELVVLSNANRSIICRAYDDGYGNTAELRPSEWPEYFAGVYGGEEVMWGTEINDVLYCICPESGGLVSVLVGSELIENVVGPAFSTTGEARAYIQGLTAK